MLSKITARRHGTEALRRNCGGYVRVFQGNDCGAQIPLFERVGEGILSPEELGL